MIEKTAVLVVGHQQQRLREHLRLLDERVVDPADQGFTRSETRVVDEVVARMLVVACAPTVAVVGLHEGIRGQAVARNVFKQHPWGVE
jgi:acyl transferase domain-containing protein